MISDPEPRRVASSSIVVAGLERLLRGSVIIAAVVKITSPVRRVSERFDAVVRRRFAPDRERDVRARRVIEDNTLFKWISARLDNVVSAWRQSAAARLVAPIADDFRQAEPRHVVRLVGWMVIVAAMVYRLMVGFRDPLITRGSIAAWLGILAAGALLMVMPGPIGAAWRAKFGGRVVGPSDDVRS